jgi:hypothetical protein
MAENKIELTSIELPIKIENQLAKPARAEPAQINKGTKEEEKPKVNWVLRINNP